MRTIHMVVNQGTGHGPSTRVHRKGVTILPHAENTPQGAPPASERVQALYRQVHDARISHTLWHDSKNWGGLPAGFYAHAIQLISCYTRLLCLQPRCHTGSSVRSRFMAYQPIENYGIIGNMRTAALVGPDGSIDWFCFPRFDSPSIFAAVLDDAKGGRFQISPMVRGLRHKQFYWPDTNVLVTRFLSPDGVGQITDFMPVGVSEGEPGH